MALSSGKYVEIRRAADIDDRITTEVISTGQQTMPTR
jgi:hypothetical protein